MSQPVAGSWQYRCPKGHTNIRPREGGHYCDSCRAHYALPPIDAARVESFPVDGTPEGGPSPWAVLVSVVDVCGRPTRATTQASEVADELDCRTGVVVSKLAALETFGAVQRRERSARDLYLPTRAGRSWVTGASEGAAETHSDATDASEADP